MAVVGGTGWCYVPPKGSYFCFWHVVRMTLIQSGLELIRSDSLLCVRLGLFSVHITPRVLFLGVSSDWTFVRISPSSWLLTSILCRHSPMELLRPLLGFQPFSQCLREGKILEGRGDNMTDQSGSSCWAVDHIYALTNMEKFQYF